MLCLVMAWCSMPMVMADRALNASVDSLLQFYQNHATLTTSALQFVLNETSIVKAKDNAMSNSEMPVIVQIVRQLMKKYNVGHCSTT